MASRFTPQNLVYLATLFVLLSPGLLLTLPSLTPSEVAAKGIAKPGGLDAAVFCASAAGGDYASTTANNCKKAAALLMSGQTSPLAAVVHAAVFGAAVVLLPTVVSGVKPFTSQQIIAFAALFFVLSPGILVTLPALTKQQCGVDKNVADNTAGSLGPDGGFTTTPKFCNSVTTLAAGNVNCTKCTSIFSSRFTNPLPIGVHAVVFTALLYVLGPAYLA